jgi:predicted enzyme related to lactoylglutathione lyase
MKVIEIAFSCYPVTDLKRARSFYESTLGLKESRIFGDDKKAWVEYDIGASTLAITNMAEDWQPSPNGGGVGLETESFDSAIAELKKAGVKFRMEATETPVCFMALVYDLDGNCIFIPKARNIVVMKPK